MAKATPVREAKSFLLFLRSCFLKRSSAFDLLDLPNDCVEVRPFAGIELGVEQVAIGADFEGAAARWNERERRDPIAEVENFSRQTDGFRGVVSNHAILDPDFGFHRSLLSESEISGVEWRVKLETLFALRSARDDLYRACGVALASPRGRRPQIGRTAPPTDSLRKFRPARRRSCRRRRGRQR